MNKKGIRRVLLACAFAVLASAVASAQVTKVKGVINGRSGETMTVQTQDAANVTVLLTATTKVADQESIFQRQSLAVTALVPGLQVTVKGSYNAQKQLVAEEVFFWGSNLQRANDIQAGVTPIQQEVEQQQKEIAAEQKASAEHAAEIAANKAAIDAAIKRFGELGDYIIRGEVTVLFGNDKTAVAPEYTAQLLKLAQQAKGFEGYMIMVQGYASKVGSAALNQKLSTERAENVTVFLEQQGQVPLTHMLAPGAMGTSKQVASDKTAEGQAENRRVVVRILQNKGIAGAS
jgi:outer membrane protein OmpA-like peptidoglycan-associated protein